MKREISLFAFAIPLLFGISIFISFCEKKDTPVPLPEASSIQPVSDNSQSAEVGQALGSTAGKQSLTVSAFKADGTTALTGSPITVNATATVKEAASIELFFNIFYKNYPGWVGVFKHFMASFNIAIFNISI